MQPTQPDSSTVGNRSVLRRIYDILRLPVLLAILAVLAWQIWAGRDELGALSLHWNPLEFGGAVLAAVGAYQMLFAASVVLLQRTGLFHLGMTPAYASAWWVSYLYRYVPGKMLLVIERARLGHALGIPYAIGAAMPLVETLVAILAGASIAVFAVAYVPVSTTLSYLVVGLIVVALLLIPRAYRYLASLPFMERRYPELGRMQLGTMDLLAVALPLLAHYLLLGLAFFLFARLIAPIPWSALPGICGIYALSHVFSLLVVIAPAGLGIREGTLAVLLATVVPAGVASALALGARTLFTAVELLCFVAASTIGYIAKDRDLSDMSAD